MKRSEFLKKTGAVSLGIGAMAVIPTTSVEGGVNDNTTYEKLLGHKSIANVGDGTVTGAIGNEALQTNAQNLSGAVNELKKSVSDGKKLLADTITGKGVQTASDATFETIANNIGTLADNLSSASTDSYNRGYSQGVTDADNRANPSSTNYKTGYNAGVSAADNRVNPNSANYKAGYSAGASSSTIHSLSTTISGGGSPGEYSCASNSNIGLRGRKIIGYGVTASTCSGGHSAGGSVGIKDISYDASNDRFTATLCTQRSQGALATYTITAWYQ